jgi:hypothetical protein
MKKKCRYATLFGPKIVAAHHCWNGDLRKSQPPAAVLNFGWMDAKIQPIKKLHSNIQSGCRVYVAPTKTLHSCDTSLLTWDAFLTCGEVPLGAAWPAVSTAENTWVEFVDSPCNSWFKGDWKKPKESLPFGASSLVCRGLGILLRITQLLLSSQPHEFRFNSASSGSGFGASR